MKNSFGGHHRDENQTRFASSRRKASQVVNTKTPMPSVAQFADRTAVENHCGAVRSAEETVLGLDTGVIMSLPRTRGRPRKVVDTAVVSELLRRGLSVPEIAENLGMSVQTLLRNGAAEIVRDAPAQARVGQKAVRNVNTVVRSPSVNPIVDAHGVSAGERATFPLETAGLLPLSGTVARIRELQVQRVFCIKSQSRCDRSVEALIARVMGYSPESAEQDRKKIWNRAMSIRRAVEKSGQDGLTAEDRQNPTLVALVPLIAMSAQAREPWDNYRQHIEKNMREAARLLPGYDFVQNVKGFGDLGFAIVVGEAGDLANYATKERLWKRLGLAVINGDRQGAPSSPSAEAWKQHGYSSRRRAEMWTLFSDSLFRQQWRAEKTHDDGTVIPAGPTGPYGEIYAKRRTYLMPRIGATADLPDKVGTHRNPEKYSAGRVHNDARRIMTKELLADLWRAWRRATEQMNTNDRLPSAEPLAA